MMELTQLLHYRVEGRLGEGGMGVVYRAVDTRLDRPVALKLLPEAQGLGPDAKQRLVLEAKAAANLDHPNIGVVHDIEDADGRLFIVMALYQGETLQARLSRGAAEPAEAAGWCLQVARGLAKAHEAGLVHRDVKPANLFLTRDGLVKILDFGLVKLEDTGGLTVPGTILGTPEYMAPEQVRGRPPDARADVWSLGVVLYEALTGVSPFRTEGGLPAVILQVMTAVPPPLAEVAPGVPPGFQPVLDAALAKDPEDRYPTITAMEADLERILIDVAGVRGASAAGAAVPGSAPGSAAPAAAGASVAGVATAGRAPEAIMEVTLADASGRAVHALLEPVPHSERFVGRERELAELRSRLDRSRLVALRGMAGGGKSAVGARLVRERYPEERVCWFTFDAVEKGTVDALYWSVAAFLAAHGEGLLWRYLKGEIEAHRPLDRTARLNLFLSSVAGAEFAFCFDEVHLVAGDREVAELFKALHRQVARAPEASGAAFLIMGRELPSDLEHLAVTLEGLSVSEAGALLEDREVELSGPDLQRLHERTHGNPTLLELAASALEPIREDAAAVSAFVGSMAGRSDLRDYVMNHVCADLSAEERAVLDALSVFAGAVDSELAEEALADGGLRDVARGVRALVQKAIVHESEKGQLRCHDLVREFCYRELDARTRRGLHARAAAVYEERKNPLRAAYHAFEQGDAVRALGLLTAHAKAIIEAGGGASLLEQLIRFDPRELEEEQQLQLVLIKGEALTVRGEYRQALTLYEVALDDVLEDEGRAELWSRLASVSNELGEHEAALGHAREALDALDAVETDDGRARVQRVLGVALYRLGRLDDAAAAFAAGLELAERDGDAALAAYLDQYLALVDLHQERLDAARQRLERSRRAFRAHRDRTGEAMAMGNLALVHHRLGQPDRERALLNKMRDVLEQVGDVGHLLILYNNLGHIDHHAGRHEEALAHHERLVDLARRVDHRPWQAAGLVGLADDLLALGRVAEARDRAQAAHDLLADACAPDAVELALACRALGDVALALGEPDQARSWFEASIPAFEALHEHDELAKVRRGLARADAANAGGSPAEREHVHEPG